MFNPLRCPLVLAAVLLGLVAYIHHHGAVDRNVSELENAIGDPIRLRRDPAPVLPSSLTSGVGEIRTATATVDASAPTGDGIAPQEPTKAALTNAEPTKGGEGTSRVGARAESSVSQAVAPPHSAAPPVSRLRLTPRLPEASEGQRRRESTLTWLPHVVDRASTPRSDDNVPAAITDTAGPRRATRGDTTAQPAATLPDDRVAPAPVPFEPTATRQHRIVDGDSLRQLAGYYLGDEARYMEIFEANRDILVQPDLLPLGQRLRIPAR